MPSGSCLARHPWLKNVTRKHTGAVVDVELHQRSALAGPPGAHLGHPGEHHGLLTHLHGRHVALAGAVDPPPGVVGDQVEHGGDAQRCERIGPLLPDPADRADRDLGQPAQAPTAPAGAGRGVCHGRVAAHSMLMRYGYNGWPP